MTKLSRVISAQWVRNMFYGGTVVPQLQGLVMYEGQLGHSGSMSSQCHRLSLLTQARPTVIPLTITHE